MGKGYSMDLRERVVEAYDSGEGSVEELAVRFKLSVPTIYRWLARHRETGSFGPLPHGGGQVPAFDEGLLNEFQALALDNNDATEEELRQLWHQKHKPVSLSVIHRALVKLKLTRKKNSSGRRGRHAKSQSASREVRAGCADANPDSSQQSTR
jgi:transposase